jgi:predicted TIM-barrel fold metal-dependent hydrolase
MRIHDAHVHFASPERLTELERYLRQARVERLAAVSLPDPARLNFNPEGLLVKHRLSRPCYAFGSFDYSSRLYPECFPDESLGLRGQVERLGRLGFDGLKLFLGKPEFQRRIGLALDDPEIGEALERAAALGLPALIHVADPPVFWTRGPLAREAGPSFEELQAQALALLDRIPGLTVVFAHLLMMAHDLPRLAGILSAHPNASVDLAPGLYFYGELHRRPDEAREFLLEFRDRLLFGSDGFWFPPDYALFAQSTLQDNLLRTRRLAGFLAEEVEIENPFPYTREELPLVRGLGLARSREGRRALRRILRDNFCRLFPGRPAPVDPGACASYCEELAGRAERLARGIGRDGEASEVGQAAALAGERARQLAEIAAGFRAETQEGSEPASGDADPPAAPPAAGPASAAGPPGRSSC